MGVSSSLLAGSGSSERSSSWAEDPSSLCADVGDSGWSGLPCTRAEEKRLFAEWSFLRGSWKTVFFGKILTVSCAKSIFAVESVAFANGGMPSTTAVFVCDGWAACLEAAASPLELNWKNWGGDCTDCTGWNGWTAGTSWMGWMQETACGNCVWRVLITYEGWFTEP